MESCWKICAADQSYYVNSWQLITTTATSFSVFEHSTRMLTTTPESPYIMLVSTGKKEHFFNPLMCYPHCKRQNDQCRKLSWKLCQAIQTWSAYFRYSFKIRICIFFYYFLVYREMYLLNPSFDYFIVLCKVLDLILVFERND